MPRLEPTARIQNQRDQAYTYAAIAGLLVIALHSIGLGVMDPGKVLNAGVLALALPLIWPYLAFCAGVAVHRRWARDLAAPAACLAVVAALAVFPRYGFLDAGFALANKGATPAPPPVWHLFRKQLAYEALHAFLCAGGLYALTRPALIAQCAVERKQPDWTRGLGFPALLLLSHAFFAASEALNSALYRVVGPQGLGPQTWAPAGMALLGLAALIGLWKRRFWGWLAAGAQALMLFYNQLEGALSKASASFYLWQAKAPLAAPTMACESFCRSLPDLAVLACVLLAFAASWRQFRPYQPAP